MELRAAGGTSTTCPEASQASRELPSSVTRHSPKAHTKNLQPQSCCWCFFWQAEGVSSWGHVKTLFLASRCLNVNGVRPCPWVVPPRAQPACHSSVTGCGFNRFPDRKVICRNLSSSLAAGDQYTWRSVLYWSLSSCILVLASRLYTRIRGGV